MKTKIIEVTNAEGGGGMNWGKFLVAKFDEDEWKYRSAIEGGPLVWGRGWTEQHVWVLDLQTGEGACFRHGGSAEYDLAKHRIWVCPLYQPFLHWLYRQNLEDLDALPPVVRFTEEEAPSAWAGYRRTGRDEP